MAVELGVAHDQIMPLLAGSGLELPTENSEALKVEASFRLNRGVGRMGPVVLVAVGGRVVEGHRGQARTQRSARSM